MGQSALQEILRSKNEWVRRDDCTIHSRFCNRNKIVGLAPAVVGTLNGIVGIVLRAQRLKSNSLTSEFDMARPKRNLLATAQETSSPPASLDHGQGIARVRKAEGKNLYSVELSAADAKPLLVELHSRFRSQIWIKRGSYVLVDTNAFIDRDNKLDGEIVNVVRDEKLWRKQAYWFVPDSSLSTVC